MNSTYNLKVELMDKSGKGVFNKTYRIAIWDKLIQNSQLKEHSFEGYVR